MWKHWLAQFFFWGGGGVVTCRFKSEGIGKCYFICNIEWHITVITETGNACVVKVVGNEPPKKKKDMMILLRTTKKNHSDLNKENYIEWKNGKLDF